MKIKFDREIILASLLQFLVFTQTSSLAGGKEDAAGNSQNQDTSSVTRTIQRLESLLNSINSPESEGCDITDQKIPTDLLVHVLKQLDEPADLARVARVNKRFHNILQPDPSNKVALQNRDAIFLAVFTNYYKKMDREKFGSLSSKFFFPGALSVPEDMADTSWYASVASLFSKKEISNKIDYAKLPEGLRAIHKTALVSAFTDDRALLKKFGLKKMLGDRSPDNLPRFDRFFDNPYDTKAYDERYGHKTVMFLNQLKEKKVPVDELAESNQNLLANVVKEYKDNPKLIVEVIDYLKTSPKFLTEREASQRGRTPLLILTETYHAKPTPDKRQAVQKLFKEVKNQDPTQFLVNPQDRLNQLPKTEFEGLLQAGLWDEAKEVVESIKAKPGRDYKELLRSQVIAGQTLVEFMTKNVTQENDKLFQDLKSLIK